MGDHPMDSQAHAFLEDLSRLGPQEIVIEGHLLKRGGRVRLKPRPNGDFLDKTLAGRVGVIEGIEHDDRGTAHVAVILEDDPGRDLAGTRHPTRRYLFAPQEVEPADEETGSSSSRRVLVAGIGNVFFGDDGFGVVVARRLGAMELARRIEVMDFGIRGLDLAYTLGQPYDAAILVDAVAAGGPPGCLQVIQPDHPEDETSVFDGHRMNPLAVLRLARRLEGLPPQVFLVGCEPSAIAESEGPPNAMDRVWEGVPNAEFRVGGPQPESMSVGLSAPVAAAVEKAARIVLELAGALLADRSFDADGVRANPF
jgi:hydrogenase maturation protease